MALIQDVSDTARWVAWCRAQESTRVDALFRDPFASHLAGELGERIVKELPGGQHDAWALIVRTHVLDQMILSIIAQHQPDIVVNLGAGLDTRPYRLPVPSHLKWLEVDLPAMTRYKRDAMSAWRPNCHVECMAVDLADGPSRRCLFDQLGTMSTHALVISEGILIYFDEELVASIARDLRAQSVVRHWVLDFVTGVLGRHLMSQWGAALEEGRAPFRFCPDDGPEYFSKHGWRPATVRYTSKEGRRYHREARLTSLPRLLELRRSPEKWQNLEKTNGCVLLEPIS
jgi:methyltransferase (TIGR00027 family)